MKKKILKFIVGSMMCFTIMLGIGTNSYAANNEMDYWTNKETYQLFYHGYIQFQPCFYTTGNYGTDVNKHVYQAYINYSRNGESLIGGRKYTRKANSWKEYCIYHTAADCKDTLNPFAPKTKFNYGWIYHK